ncbi:hypothetical protein M436DRAFT_63119 [Aureobasidium namibiae CBS 147.97]|uniref:Mid2 domain-containing protein n=1 Tax=Aureobasidium namibiae CBS 147.97 TaxID=1043004 RepID=A0A074WKU6_9PEZI|nr:uncharacterized protein M436DRAFT_63119 [Aureobasidium namibiae CBS 147.97]KEQ73755.1 hypothetical protein M436DRAFT_63119 [Aureobasidium namibiae CBS 147.97]
MASLLLRAVSAQTCYYPDGLTTSDDIPCNSNAATSSCCPTGSFCMDNGLCFGGGVVSRSSCTDQAWASPECAQYCTDVNESTAIGLTACDVNSRTFACGLNGGQCQNTHSTFTMVKGDALVLRPAQIQVLVSNYSAPANQGSHQYGVGSMIGVALGVGLPLAFSLLMALLVLRKERQRFALQNIFEQRLEPMDAHGNYRRRSFSTLSKSGTMTTIASTSTYAPKQPQASLPKYGFHKGYYSHGSNISVPVFELPSNPPERHERVEAP